MPEFADWTRAFAMVGTDGVDWVPVLLSPDGSMYSVLQGEYEGALRTVKLDDEGRMSAFVIDSVDAWGNMLSIGNSELAVRLGSSVCYERTGEVQLVETFECGLQRWAQAGLGDGAAIELTPVTSASGGYSVKLTGGDDSTRLAQIAFRRGLLPQGVVGLAVGFALIGTIDYFAIKIEAYDGVNYLYAGIRFDDDDDSLDWLGTAGAWWEIADVVPAIRLLQVYNRIKLVVDLTNETYIRCLFNEVSYDLSAHAVSSASAPGTPYIKCMIELYSRYGNNDVAYVDDVVFTVAET